MEFVLSFTEGLIGRNSSAGICAIFLGNSRSYLGFDSLKTMFRR